jgi:hypothetical protein
MNNFWVQINLILRIYADSFVKTGKVAFRFWWVGVTVIVFQFILFLVGFLVRPLHPFLGGILLALVMDAVISSFLVMIEAMMKQRKITLEQFKASFGVYFWDVMGVFFLLWIAQLLILQPVLNSGLIWVYWGLYLTILILFNPIPELIYHGRNRSSGSIELYRRAYDFIIANWIEWYIPNVIFIVVFYFIYFDNFLLKWVMDFLMGPFGGFPMVLFFFTKAIVAVFGGTVLYFIMVYRGFLFNALSTTSRRSRLFQYRAHGGKL